MSISEYPNIDAASRYGRQFNDLGAAALLFRNNDELFPEFAGRDLKSRRTNFEFVDLATDGATLPTVMSQLGGIGHSAAIITLTVGGNDMLSEVWSTPSAAHDIAGAIEQIADAYEVLVSRIRARRLAAGGTGAKALSSRVSPGPARSGGCGSTRWSW